MKTYYLRIKILVGGPVLSSMITDEEKFEGSFEDAQRRLVAMIDKKPENTENAFYFGQILSVKTFLFFEWKTKAWGYSSPTTKLSEQGCTIDTPHKEGCHTHSLQLQALTLAFSFPRVPLEL